MTRYIVEGGHPLHGNINIGGAKNAAVAILVATLLVDGVCKIENLPDISDVRIQLAIMEAYGAKIKHLDQQTVEIDGREVQNTKGSSELMQKIRASYYHLGALLGRFGEAEVAMPGGCNFGIRPIDLHIKGFQAQGAKVDVTQGGYIHAAAEGGKLRGGRVYLDIASVGATINIMLAGVLADGVTTIENAAREPHIVDLANFLNSMGGSIHGAGTNVIKIRGVKRLHGGNYAIIPDQIEAGTYLAALAAAGGEITLRNVIPKHLDCITAKLVEVGVEFEDLGDAVRARRNGTLHSTNFKTAPYPGFPTDMQPQLATVLTMADGVSVITEGIWDNRFKYLEELRRMGVKAQVNGKVAVIEGVSQLHGAPIRACDLRAGAAMVIAGLAANGTTEISDVYHIERGYENLVEKLNQVGAHIKRVE